MNSKSINKRNASLDILRIVSMFLIIMIHFQGKTGWLRASDAVGLNSDWWLRWWILSFCNISVNCYVMLSGYFLINSKFRLSKVITLWLKVFFWSVFIWGICVFVFKDDVGIRQSLSAFLPISTYEYWFITNYIALYLFSPFINKLLLCLTRNQHRSLIIVSVVLFSIWTTIFGDVFNGHDGCNLLWFCTLYSIAAYIRLYGNDMVSKSKYIYLVTPFAVSVLYILIRYVCILLDHPGTSERFLPYASITCLIASYSFFRYFTLINVHPVKPISAIISFLSTTSLGVYLIHEHPLARPYLWSFVEDYIDGSSQYYIYYFSEMIITCLLIYMVCSLAEYLRIVMFTRVEKSKLVENISILIQSKIYKD